MKLEAFITVEYTGKNGRRYKRTRKAHSFVRAFIDILYSKVSQIAVTNGAVDTGGVARTIEDHVYNFRAVAGIGVITSGIRVGTGVNVVAIGDYALQTPIAEGTGAGQLSHAAVTFSNPVTSGSSRQFTVSRTLTNNSGGNITVNEVALYVMAATSPFYFCADRTLNTFTINNGTSATVTYTIKVTV